MKKKIPITKKGIWHLYKSTVIPFYKEYPQDLSLTEDELGFLVFVAHEPSCMAGENAEGLRARFGALYAKYPDFVVDLIHALRGKDKDPSDKWIITRFLLTDFSLNADATDKEIAVAIKEKTGITVSDKTVIMTRSRIRNSM